MTVPLGSRCPSRETPIAKAREVLEWYGIPMDAKWVGADPTASGPKRCATLLRDGEMGALRRKLEAKVVYGVYAR